MRTRLIALLVGCLLVPLTALAQDKDAAVKEIDLKGLKRDFPKGKMDMPTTIKNAEELAKAFPEADIQERIKKEVDFAKQQLLFFAWAGSGGDRLAFTAGKGEKGPEVTFQTTRGLTRDLRSHFHLYVMPKDATWKVEAKK